MAKAAKAGKKKSMSKADRDRRGRNTGLYILGGLALLFVLYLIDHSGPIETINGICVNTSTYPHTGNDGTTHTHVKATLEYEGHRYDLSPGDRFAVGDPVSVEVRRGRISRYPYYSEAFRRQE